ncbi:Hsp70 family protein, partial [Dehalococcoidia bacterium]|nr:Hsp70 family protein [Dehalococcoidia bacterium]
QFAADDAQRREEVEIRNNADSLTYNAEKMVADHGDKVSEEVKTQIEGKIQELKTALAGTDISQIQPLTEELSVLIQQIGAAMYEEAGQEPEGTEPQDGGSDDEDDDEAIEGEYREVKE